MAYRESVTHDLENYANILKAIAHPLRIAIIELLDEKDGMSVTSIYEKLGIEQAVASHHLGILKNKGVLVSSRAGKNMIYQLRHKQISQVMRSLEKFVD